MQNMCKCGDIIMGHAAFYPYNPEIVMHNAIKGGEILLDGNKIRILREARDLTTSEFAEAVGISQTMVSLMERGIKSPSIEVLKRVADYLGCKVDFLLLLSPSTQEKTEAL